MPDIETLKMFYRPLAEKCYPDEVTDVTQHCKHIIVNYVADLETLYLQDETSRF